MLAPEILSTCGTVSVLPARKPRITSEFSARMVLCRISSNWSKVSLPARSRSPTPLDSNALMTVSCLYSCRLPIRSTCAGVRALSWIRARTVLDSSIGMLAPEILSTCGTVSVLPARKPRITSEFSARMVLCRISSNWSKVSLPARSRSPTPLDSNALMTVSCLYSCRLPIRSTCAGVSTSSWIRMRIVTDCSARQLASR